MATKTGAAAATKEKPAKTRLVATFPDPPDKERADAFAALALKPSVNAAAVMVEYTKPLGNQDLGALARGLSDGIKEVWGGDMKGAEAMLYGQAHALQTIFMNLARRATSQEYLKQWETYLRMALKAQNQCRMTLETLATIKNPPVVIARQANINNGGQQQVNNMEQAGCGTKDKLSRTATAPAAPNELLEANDGPWLDAGAPSAASDADPHLETVGAFHRTAHK
jgi:hypothetical protein